MKTETKTSDIDLFSQAMRAAEELYEPMGFMCPCHGYLLHRNLHFELLPFWGRGDESPIQYALRSAFESGRAQGLQEAQQKKP